MRDSLAQIAVAEDTCGSGMRLCVGLAGMEDLGPLRLEGGHLEGRMHCRSYE